MFIKIKEKVMNFEKFANIIVKGRFVFLSIFFVLLVASAILLNFVNVNYDLTEYLPNNSNTKQSIEIMQEEFGATGTASIMITNTTKNEAQNIANLIAQKESVATCVVSRYQLKQDSTTQGYALINIFLTDGDYTTEAESTIKNIKQILSQNLTDDQQYYLTGSAVTSGASRTAIMNEIPIIMLMAILVVALVLLFTTRSWIEPVILLLVIGTAILINMGTNYLLGQISFISNSVSSVLLIALAMDYSIVLINRFREEREKEPNVYIAMQNTLKGSIVTIVSSGLTVMAGLISLVFMDYKIGLDMGLVLTKGVFISILAVIFLMPAILLLFSKMLKKTEHKNFLRGLKHIGSFAKHTRFVMPIVFLVLIVAAFAVQHTMLNFDYVAKFSNNNDQTYKDEQEVSQIFGEQNSLVLMLKNNNAFTPEYQIALFNEVKNIQTQDGTKPANNDTASSFMTSGTDTIKLGNTLNAESLIYAFGLTDAEAQMLINGAGSTYGFADETNLSVYAYNIIVYLGTNQDIQTYLNTAHPELMPVITNLYKQEQTAQKIFNSQNYTRMIFNINAGYDNKNAIEYINNLHSYLNKQNIEYYIVNNTQNVIETQEVFKTDRLKVELISALAILVIVCFAFKSISLPVLLVLIIEGAIWVNLAGNAIIGNSIFFICYLLGTAIQMGATIDYGILLCDRYIEARKTQNKYDAIKTAIDKSFATILSSGTILTLAAFCIGIFSSTPLLSSIGYVIGAGALCACIAILFILPQTLLLCDKLINKTTLHANFINNSTQTSTKTCEETIIKSTAQNIEENIDNKK